jgi:branched-chain amino acid aminotransferase
MDIAGRDIQEILFVNENGILTEGAISNLVIIKDNKVFTPSASCCILKGVTRHLVLEACERLGLDCIETSLTRHDLYCADEAFITMTSQEVTPVAVCDGRLIGNGRPGPLTKRIHKEFCSCKKINRREK